jgi:hypothetical protein
MLPVLVPMLVPMFRRDKEVDLTDVGADVSPR